MNIGNTHVDGGVVIAIVLIAGSLLAIVLLYGRPRPPIEHPSARIVRLVRATRSGIQPNCLYFVEESNDEVHIVERMSYARRIFHPRGRALRIHGSKLQVAEVSRNEDPKAVHGRRFVDYDD